MGFEVPDLPVTPEQQNRPKCIIKTCTHYARVNDIFCSRHNTSDLTRQEAATLPRRSEPQPQAAAPVPDSSAQVQPNVIQLVPDSPPQGPFYSRKEFADMFGVSQGTVAKWENSGKISMPYVVPLTGRIKYSNKHVAEVQQMQQVQQKAATITQQRHAAKGVRSSFRSPKTTDRSIRAGLGKLIK